MDLIYTKEIMGTVWNVSANTVTLENKDLLIAEIDKTLREFDALYSRFIANSLVRKIASSSGVYEVPEEFVSILLVYKTFYEVSDKRCTPCVGFFLEDIGYDETYSFIEKKDVRPLPSFDNLIILDKTHIECKEAMLLDIGAMGKGYAVDLLGKIMVGCGVTSYLIDGSGDILYTSNPKKNLTIGLEHPYEHDTVIGIITMTEGAMCSSALGRRSWGSHTHYVDPVTNSHPEDVIATWVIAPSCAYADIIATVLFFVAPEKIKTELPHVEFEYCILRKDFTTKKSEGYKVNFF